MEFGEKLQSLRKSKGLTQEELSEYLYVSRTAVSKWESGRGYPSLDSIKEIASFFSVTIDELLSSEKMLSIAEKENKQNLQKLCHLLFGIFDLLALLLCVLPLYPNRMDGYVSSVNLLSYTPLFPFHATVYWVLFLILFAFGVLRIVLTQGNIQKGETVLSLCSMVLSALSITFLILTRQVYATMILFVLFLIKGLLHIMRLKI